jgi:hypothetical protein
MRFEIFFHKGKKMRERINRKKWVDFEDKINHAIGKPNQKKSTNGRTTNADLFTRTASTN